MLKPRAIALLERRFDAPREPRLLAGLALA